MVVTSPAETGFGATLISSISVAGSSVGSGSLSKWEQLAIKMLINRAVNPFRCNPLSSIEANSIVLTCSK